MPPYLTITEHSLKTSVTLTEEKVDQADTVSKLKAKDSAEKQSRFRICSSAGGGRLWRQLVKDGEIDPDSNPCVSNGKFCNQDFYQLRDFCVEKGEYFKDQEFPPDEHSLYYSDPAPDFAKGVEWKRASELSENPKVIEETASRFDVNQGYLGNCWYLAAMSNLAQKKKYLYRVVPKDNSFTENYAGIFHFKFWRYGEWIDVVVDDYLPTRYNEVLEKNELLFVYSKSKDEFWSALLEKAYAKLHGSYQALDGGKNTEAMVDFTGGISERCWFKDEYSPYDHFRILKLLNKSLKQNAMLVCTTGGGGDTNSYSNGLVCGHAYTITKVINANRASELPTLIRIRNPSGQTEWNGAWSDKSMEWQSLSEEEKERIGLQDLNDGECWMSYEDFISHRDCWETLEICNVPRMAHKDKCGKNGGETSIDGIEWELTTVEGSWSLEKSAGGRRIESRSCRVLFEAFALNPQFRFRVQDPDDDDEDRLCSVIVSLMQKGGRAFNENKLLDIGFYIYHLKTPDTLLNPLRGNFFRKTKSVYRPEYFAHFREVTCRMRLAPGTYCVIPATYEAGQEGDFILRVLTEAPINVIT